MLEPLFTIDAIRTRPQDMHRIGRRCVHEEQATLEHIARCRTGQFQTGIDHCRSPARHGIEPEIAVVESTFSATRAPS